MEIDAMAHDGPSRAEFERLYQTIDEGFRGVHQRLDVSNGRLRTVELADANIMGRLVTVETAMFSKEIGRKSTESSASTTAAAVSVGLTAVLAGFKAIELIGTALLGYAMKVIK